MTEVSYQTVPFRGRPVPWTSPAALALTSFVNGGPRLDPNGPLRFLELGCGDGANIVPLAQFRPKLTVVGLDQSAHALAVARGAAAELGLENLRLIEGDLAHLQPDEPFDIIVAHGVYSWIDEGHRAAMRRLIGGALADGGVAYVSFNALPGWSVRGRVRDALIRSEAGGLEGARARIDGLRRLLGDEPQNMWQTLIAHELERAAAASDGYLAHEYLADDNEAFWLGDVVRAFEEEGLVYLGDAMWDRPEGFVDPEVRGRAEAIQGDRIAREEWIDLREFRQLHAAVFARTRGASPTMKSRAEAAWIASAARRERDPFDITPGVVERFAAPYGRQLEISDATLKMALLLLADRYPLGTRFATLFEECAERLAAQEIEGADRETLAAQLAQLHAELAVELRMDDPSLRHEPGDRPVATPLTRFEARTRDVLTTPLHTMLPLEPIDRAIVGFLDGSRARDEVVAAVVAGVVAGAIEIEGAPAGAARLTPLVESRVGVTVTTLGWWGLCS